MKYLILNTLVITSLLFVGCSEDSEEDTNTNTYNLQAVNLSAPNSGLLTGSYSNGTTGSIFLARTNIGSDFVNGVAVTNIQTDTSITLDNGYTSQSSGVSKIDANGFTLEINDTTTCSITSGEQVLPTSASVGAVSSSTAIYSCDDSTYRTVSWEVSNAGSGNAYYILDTVISGATQSENTTTLTITPNNEVIYYKLYVNIIADDITATFEGSID